jgi:hypothetical protein
MSTRPRPLPIVPPRPLRDHYPNAEAQRNTRRMHAGSLEALRVTRPEAVDLEAINQSFAHLHRITERGLPSFEDAVDDLRDHSSGVETTRRQGQSLSKRALVRNGAKNNEPPAMPSVDQAACDRTPASRLLDYQNSTPFSSYRVPHKRHK